MKKYQAVTPSAFHSRSAWASRGDTSGYSASSPTVGRIFQERAHLVPTAFSTTTATPGTSFSLNASDGASLLVTIAFDVMLTSARSISNSVSKIFLSETYTSGDASSEEPMFLAARSTSSAPVTTRRTSRMISHFAASASSRKASNPSGNSVRCTDGSASGRYIRHASSVVKLSTGASHFRIASQMMSIAVSAAFRASDDGGSQYSVSLRMSK